MPSRQVEYVCIDCVRSSTTASVMKDTNASYTKYEYTCWKDALGTAQTGRRFFLLKEQDDGAPAAWWGLVFTLSGALLFVFFPCFCVPGMMVAPS